VICPLIPEIAAEAVLDREIFAGGCVGKRQHRSWANCRPTSLKLYYDDFIDRWNGFLRDVRLAPIDRTEHRRARTCATCRPRIPR
jgi:type VI secretion system protein ImpL